ncbi:MAG: energy-coupling factor ABC transporter ATP-binding protein [Gloeomargarita sp. SKYG116]|nr:energy-coupling factor ABC transporter ATP-binding protein [Gloeomargarita sp. SKYG116]MDW8401680.1 ABC transporter ATP-binding protein [Gloeomargarita sp. SKYGB_i_bin116]
MGLAFHRVSYTYPSATQPAVVELDLTMPAGYKTVILGRNGCGKSTALLLAAGLYRGYRGVITWRGERLQHHWPWRQRIGLTFQDPEHQLVGATVAEDIAYGLSNLSLSRSEIAKRLSQILADFDLEALADVPLHHLSLGQKRRVALAGVMALQPELLLLDEPTTYLDHEQTQTLLHLLHRIHSQGTTVVMATHDLDLAYAWADWVVWLDQGRVMVADWAERVWMNSELLAQLGTPTLWAAWQALPAPWRDGRVAPKTLKAWQHYWQERG